MMKSSWRLLLALSLICIPAAHASDHAQTQYPIALAPQPVQPKSAGLAVALSLAGTALPVAAAYAVAVTPDPSNPLVPVLAIGGLLAGPSLGQFYGASPGGGALGIGIRTLGLGMAVAGAIAVIDDYCNDRVEDQCGKEGDGAGLFWAGLFTYAGGLTYSLINGVLAVKRFNANLQDPDGFSWAPTLEPTSEGSLRAGATAWMHF